jgi:energy-coupling factor transporter ATP-binding protein EcfA2
MTSIHPPDGGASLQTLETASSRGPDEGLPLARHQADSNAPHRAAGWAVDLKGISYTYEGEAETVIANVSLQISDGEFVLVMGPSGCGKSTLLQLLNGTIPHTLRGRLEGEALVCGKPVAETKVAIFSTEVGMVFQDPEGQIINSRVRDEVAFGLENLCRPVSEILEQQKRALAAVDLTDAAERSIFDLSGGQKQRVSIAAVLAARPRLLVLDEPTANLDPAGMREVFAVLDKLRADYGTTIVMVEHRVDELADKVTRVIMMDHGRIVFDGPPREAFALKRAVHSEEAGTAPRGAWFPQIAEFALEYAEATGMPLDAANLPLNETEMLAHLAPRLGALNRPVASPPPLPAADAEPDAPFLSVRHLSFAYPGAAPTLKDVNLELTSGSIVALLGRNGSGKTTLARALMGINPPPKKAIMIDGKDVANLRPSELASIVGYVFQNPDHQFVTDRVDEEIAYGLKVRDYAEETIRQRVSEMLEIVDLERYRFRSPFSLSHGERRRLSVATMLVLEPKLLILDEPTIGQDHERAQQLMALMVRLKERYRTTVLMITHDVRLVAEWAERALVMSDGRLAFDGTPEALFAETGLMEDAGLICPPIHRLSTVLGKEFPDIVTRPALSVGTLIAQLAA